MNILFYDIEKTGHHSEYIYHLVNYLVEQELLEDNYYFVVHPDFQIEFPRIISVAKTCNHIHFIPAESLELHGLKIKNRFKRSFRNFDLMHKYAVELKIDLCYLLHINVFQIALGLRRTSYKVKGILFMQFTNMHIRGIHDYYYYLRRYFPLWLCAKNPNLERIFVLNDASSASSLNKKFKKDNVFRYLPDPIPHFEVEQGFSLRERYKISPNKTIFLHFGSLSERKGTIEILDAITLLSDQEREKMALLVVGKTSDNKFKELVVSKIKSLQEDFTAQIVLEHNFVSESQMAGFFQQSDVVLIPYKNAEASSGVLGHAVYADKKIIGPSFGLIGRLISDLGLGLAVAEINPKDIARALIQIEKVSLEPTGKIKFVKDHSPYNFATTLLCS